MVATRSYAFDRDRWPTDWRAVGAVIAFHALLLAAFMLSRLQVPDLARVDRTMFVSLFDSVPRLEVRRTSAVEPAAAARRPNPVRSKATAKNPLLMHRAATVVPEGRESPGDGGRTLEAATVVSLASTDAARSQSMVGSGSASGPKFRPARVVHRSPMRYPTDAFTAHQQGSVDVIVDIATDGTPVEAHVEQSSGSSPLDDAAVAAVLQWTFRPAERNGVATQAQAIVTIDWTIGPVEIHHFAQPGNGTSQDERVKRRALGRKYSCLSATDSELCRDPEDQHRRR